jgi:hypothetical protein
MQAPIKAPRTLIDRGHDLRDLWAAIVPGTPVPELVQCLRWAQQHTDKQIEIAFTATYLRHRYKQTAPDEVYRSVAGALASMQSKVKVSKETEC